MCTQRLYAGIVSYNPDIERLRENICAINNQVSEVIVFDNGSDNFEAVEEIILEFKNVRLIKSDKNIGIAAALNRMMQWGFDLSYKWMLSLDQDSVCSDDYVKKMLPYLTIQPNLGIVAPVIVDRNIGIIGHNPTSEYCYTRDCVTGLLTILLKGKDGEAYNVANPDSHTTIVDMAKMVANKIADGEIKVVFDIPESNTFGYAADTKMKLNSDKLQKIGWKPEIGLEEAYKRTIKWMKSK